MAHDSTTMEDIPKTSCLASSFPVLLPEDPLLTVSAEEFEKAAHKELQKIDTTNVKALSGLALDASTSSTILVGSATDSDATVDENTLPEGMTLTTNSAPAHADTGSALLDLCTELEKTVSGERLKSLLEAAWAVDALATLKIVFNARSIHLGKGEMESFYKSIGWMKDAHPETAITNMQWLYRSIIDIEMKDKKKTDEDELELVDATDDGDASTDIERGGAHGYWKDLLNILVLAVQNKLNASDNPRDALHKPNENGPKAKRQRLGKENKDYYSKEASKERRHTQERVRHENVLKMLKDPFYRILHLSVARQFASTLLKDLIWLKSEDKKDLRKISLAAKWAPSIEGFHDKHTFIASAIAEILYPHSTFQTEFPDEGREMYLKRARASYHRLTLAPLRKALEVVERDITTETFNKINYSGVPSVAMNNYKNLFIKKDFGRYEKYIDRVASNKAKINATVLTPSTLIMQARGHSHVLEVHEKMNAKQILEAKVESIQIATLDGQWKSLVQRIKNAGTLKSTIAVCDVSGSMTGPRFPDKTAPIDTSVGLSLLLAEVTAAPFGGKFITFSERPQFVEVGGDNDHRSLAAKVREIERSNWSMNTNFVAVFETLLLPLALKHKVKPEEMVKTIFVFSDMQFDSAQMRSKKFETAHQRIEKKYRSHGYELPRIVYWNIAGGSHSTRVGMPKPVTKDTNEALMVSGYSQAMLKMFLDNGSFEGSLDEEAEEVTVEEDGKVEVKKVKRKVDPTDGVWRAIEHKAYDGLKVVD